MVTDLWMKLRRKYIICMGIWISKCRGGKARSCSLIYDYVSFSFSCSMLMIRMLLFAGWGI